MNFFTTLSEKLGFKPKENDEEREEDELEDDEEQDDEDEEEDEERLTDDSGGKFVLGGTASLHFFFKRCEHPIVGRGDDFTTVDDFLTAHHHTACQRNAAQQIGLLRLRSFLVVYQVRLHVVVQVAA